ncbi:glycosyltransferase family 61 protein [Autumnicola musiva]|uniref:Glycosyltransferase family 61 protein n=1 Tax=Autumnicola musiva TaxID=3075589 RepID=A0ABU3D7F1_9FLAO|nr:glycosyltransferase family 61 protein [Zunongwangia sp. F117]MDT0677447.1 glycosyltransferase family 61 protein [Zunongwangia sp. F117]
MKHFFKSYYNYYSSYISNYYLKNKIRISKGAFITFNENELFLLHKAKEIFGSSLDFTNGYKQRDTFIVPLSDVNLLGNTGAVVKDLRIIGESMFDLGRLNNSKSFKNLHRLKTRKKKTGVYTSIMHPSFANKNIYHWIVDCLPRLYSISKIPSDETIYLIINDDIPDYQREILHFFVNADQRLKLVYIKKTEKWKIQNYWLPSFVSSNTSGYMPAEYINYIKKVVFDGYNITSTENDRKVYISRSLSKRRKLINEEEIESFLSGNGFDIIHAENLNYREQVKLFSECDIIISPHGAGLTNILYASNATIVELHPEDYTPSHYCLLSKACNHNYYSFFGNEMNEDMSWQLNIGSFKSFFQLVVKKQEILN